MAKRASTKKKSKNESTDNIQDEFTTREQSTNRDSSASKRNEEKLKQDGSYIVLPDVTDIPGQENIVDAGVPGEMADTTIASDDEEGIRGGKDILEEEDDTEIVMGTEADVTKEDLVILGDPDKDMDLGEDELVLKEGLDDTDTDGDPLNEAAVDEDSTGDDLDIPDADDDDPRKDPLGQDDEENNYYSLGGDKNDELNEGKKTE
jgi:hypothetical protein